MSTFWWIKDLIVSNLVSIVLFLVALVLLFVVLRLLPDVINKLSQRNSNGRIPKMPKTKTPFSVLLQLGLLAILGSSFLYILFEWILGIGPVGVILWIVIVGLTPNYYTKNVDGYDGLIILNELMHTQRTLFKGLNLILPWESDVELVSLKTELKDVSKDETYGALDGQMQVKYVYAIRPRLSGSDPGADVILFNSYEHDTVKMEGRACLSQSLSDYYATKPVEELREKRKIQTAVFDYQTGSARDRITEFEDTYGAEITITLEDSDRDAATQKARDTISQSKSIRDAYDALVAAKDGKAGIPEEEAVKMAKMLNIDGVKENIINLQGLDAIIKTLRDLIGGKV
jgi:hypothetical protein